MLGGSCLVAVGASLLHPSDRVYLGADPTRETTDGERDRSAELGLAIVDQAALR